MYKGVDQTKVTKMNIANRNNDVALVQRAEQLTNIQTEAQKTKIDLQTKRNVNLQNENANLDSALKVRQGDLQKEQNKYDSEKISVMDKVAIATSQAKVTELSGAAAYNSIMQDARASADSIEYLKNAEDDMFTKLNSVSGFNSGNIMKHVYVDTLKDKHSKVPLYVDYKKVPMMVQADGNTKRIQDLNGGPVPGV